MFSKQIGMRHDGARANIEPRRLRPSSRSTRARRAMQAAQQNELEAMTDMFNKMTEQCFRKCVALYKEPELSVGEATCVDRCVHKYMTSHAKVQEILSKHAAAAQQGGMRQ